MSLSRRTFLRSSVIGGLALTSGLPAIKIPQESKKPARVSITSSSGRADLAFRALQPFSDEIRRAIGNKTVILKPNNVLIYVPLACTHVETLEGILEFLKSINKHRNVIIAESSASGSTLEGFSNYGYYSLQKKYPVRFVDLDDEPSIDMYVTDQNDFRPHLMKMSALIADPSSYVVSVARMKTHSVVGATLSLKNLVLGAPVKDKGFTLFNEDKRFSDKAAPSKPGTVSWKRFIHGNGYHSVNYNLALLATRIHPDLAVIDGFTGMEGNGPTLGTPVEHGVCVAGTDWLAADRVGIGLMGIDFTKIGYLNHCASTGLGIADLSSIEILGDLEGNIRKYKLPDNFDKITSWIKPLS